MSVLDTLMYDTNILLILQPKLPAPKCRRNADNFLDACKQIGVPNVSNIFNLLLISVLFCDDFRQGTSLSTVAVVTNGCIYFEG